MSSSDLLIAQLQRRNRIMLGIIITVLAMIAIGSGFFIIETTVKNDILNSTNERILEEQPLDTNVVTKDLLNEKSTPSKLSASEVSQSQISTPVAFEAEKSKFLELMGDFETDLKSRVQAFPRLLLSQEYLNILDKLEKDIVSLVSQNRYTDAINSGIHQVC